ncbi:MAG: hypothetical protein JSS75_07215 [Bacteroidetes bacterium]|nr:hypothetical protein [Bacteroidota bacterium]
MKTPTQAQAEDSLVVIGGEIKALGDGRFGGMLVRFGAESDTDLERDYFDTVTDYDADFAGEVKSTVYYNHGLDPLLGRKKLGGGMKATLTMTDAGIWAEGQLDLRDEYEAKIYELIGQKKMGWSSGTAPYLVEREQVGKSFHIKRWPLGLDASITPTPAEHRNTVLPIKSLKSLSLKSMMDGEDSVLGETWSESLTINALCSLHDRFLWGGLWEIVYSDMLTVEEKIAKIAIGADDYADKIKKVAAALLALDPDELSAQYQVAKSLTFSAPELRTAASLKDHVKFVLDTTKNLAGRLATITQVSGSAKTGQQFNAANRQQLTTLADELATNGKDLIERASEIKSALGLPADDGQNAGAKSTDTTLDLAAMEARLMEQQVNHQTVLL